MSGPPNMAATVARFGVPVTLRRYSGGPAVNAQGYQVPATSADTPITMHVYPAPGRVVDRLPEGLRGKRVEMGGTTTEVRAAQEGGQRGDEIIYKGATFEVVAVQDWSGYYEATMVQVHR